VIVDPRGTIGDFSYMEDKIMKKIEVIIGLLNG
jgi:hypothetical protein